MKVTQLCPIHCNPMDYTGHGNSSGQNTGIGSLSLLQGIVPIQGLNPGIPIQGLNPLKEDSLPFEPQEKPKNTGVGSLSILQRIFPIQISNQGVLPCRWILYQLSYQGSPVLVLTAFSNCMFCLLVCFLIFCLTIRYNILVKRHCDKDF